MCRVTLERIGLGLGLGEALGQGRELLLGQAAAGVVGGIAGAADQAEPDQPFQNVPAKPLPAPGALFVEA